MAKNRIKFRVKRATVKDINPFWEFFTASVKELFPDYAEKTKNYYLKKEYTKKSVRKCIKNKTATLLLALDNDKKIMGYIMGGIPFGGIAYVSWIAVDKPFQGQGMGSKLLRRYEFIAKRQGVHKIHIWTTKRNIKFYKKNNYRLLGHISKNYFGEDDWFLYKSIQSPEY